MSDLSNEEIQERLAISKNTLKTHIRNVYAKAAVKSRYELVVKYKGDKSDTGVRHLYNSTETEPLSEDSDNRLNQ